MKKHTGYWVTVGLFCAVYAFSSFMDLSGVGPARETTAHLGFPAYLDAILGFWKAGAVVALLAPRMARVKEWAYAGIVFDLTGGFVSRVFTGDALPKPVIPLVMLALAITSYLLLPASRRLVEPARSDDARVALAPAE